MTDDATLVRKQLLGNGYAPLPISGKIPPIAEWQRKDSASDEEIATWATLYPHARSTGMLTAKTPAIDIDILDEGAAEAVEHLAREHFGERGKFLVRIGKAPKRAVLFRTETPFKKLSLLLRAANGDTGRIEILGLNQQIVVHGLHPDTRRPYAWFGGEPWTIAAEELPSITSAEAQTFLAEALAVLESEYDYVRADRKRDGNTPEPGESRAWSDCLDGILAGHGLHDSTVVCAAKLIAAGMSDGAAINLLRGLYDLSAAPRDQRFTDRYFEIVRAVDSAREKFGDAASDEASPQEPLAGDQDKAHGFSWKWRAHGEEATAVTRKWLVQEILPETGAGLIAGQWGTYKTFCAMDLAAAVMIGGQFINSAVVGRHGVVLLATEGVSEIDLRLTAAWQAHGGTGSAPFIWTTDVPRLLDRKAGQVLTAMIRDANDRLRATFGLGVGLVLIDTLGKAAGYNRSGDENDAAVVKAVMSALNSAALTTNTLVIGVTHFGKQVETGTRGSSAFEDDADTVLALIGERSAGGTVANVRLCLRKSRAGASGQEILLRPKEVTVGLEKTLVLDWVGAATAAAGATKASDGWAKKSLRLLRQALMTIVADCGKELRPWADGPLVRAVDLEIVRNQFYKLHPAAEAIDAEGKHQARKRAFARAVNDAKAGNLIGSWELEGVTYVWLITPGAPATQTETPL